MPKVAEKPSGGVIHFPFATKSDLRQKEYAKRPHYGTQNFFLQQRLHRQFGDAPATFPYRLGWEAFEKGQNQLSAFTDDWADSHFRMGWIHAKNKSLETRSNGTFGIDYDSDEAGGGPELDEGQPSSEEPIADTVSTGPLHTQE